MIKIICDINTFDLYQTIHLIDTEQNVAKTIGKCELEKLDTDIVAACAKYAVGNVVLFGNKSFISPIADEIKVLGKTKYGINNIEVEGRSK